MLHTWSDDNPLCFIVVRLPVEFLFIMLFCCGFYRYSHCSKRQPLGTDMASESLMSYSKSLSLTADHMITNKSKHFPNEHKSVCFFSSSKMCQVVPSLQLTVYQQHLDFHHTDITCFLIARTTNTLSFPLSLALCLEGENCYKGTWTYWLRFFSISFLLSSLPQDC